MSELPLEPRFRSSHEDNPQLLAMKLCLFVLQVSADLKTMGQVKFVNKVHKIYIVTVCHLVC